MQVSLIMVSRDHSVIETNRQVGLYDQGTVHGKNILYNRWDGKVVFFRETKQIGCVCVVCKEIYCKKCSHNTGG